MRYELLAFDVNETLLDVSVMSPTIEAAVGPASVWVSGLLACCTDPSLPTTSAVTNPSASWGRRSSCGWLLAGG